MTRRHAVVRVLVAEDDPDVRDALAALIADDPGLELVAAVADAPAAIETAAREHPNVAVLDVRMPGGGPAAARGIRRRSPATGVLALSAHDDHATVLEMLEAGALGYLVKGSSAQSLLDSIRDAAAGHGKLAVEVTGEVIQQLVGELSVRRRAEEHKRRRETRIRRALDGDARSIVFQPICRLADGEVVGAEALSRFSGRPRRGPEPWFAEAREVGLGKELELAAARTALAEAPALPDGVYVSVNVSPSTASSAGFRKLAAGMDTARLVIEVTEHARIPDYDRFAESLSGLRALGARLAVDDAGAGFASLTHILKLDPDFIKLDRTLIDGIDHDRPRQALAVALISFAEKIGITIIAEGIERFAQLKALRGLGVSYGQGFYLARPRPLPLDKVRAAALLLFEERKNPKRPRRARIGATDT